MPLHENEGSGADPAMVNELIQAVGEALNDAVISGVTTHADLLSCLFTLLKRALRVSKEQADPADVKNNTREVSRVLMELLVEFGSTDYH